jgi:hypothetical protein
MGDMNFPDSPELEQPYLDWSWDGEKWVHKGLTGIESKPANITTADVKLKNPQRSDFETQEDANNYFYETIQGGGGGGDVDLSPYINRNVRNDVLEGTFQIIWDDSADPTYPFNGRIGYNKNAQDPNSLDGSFLYVNGNRGTFSVGRDGDVELHGPSEIQGIADRLTGDKPWITGFSYVQADDFLDADGNSIIGSGGGGGYDDTQIKADLAQETQDRISGDDSLQKQINSLSGGGGGNDPRITDTQIGNWDTAYGWGNHASKGYLTSASLSGYATQTWVSQNYQPKGSYLTSESDPTVPPHVKSISQADINKWNNPPSGGGDDPNAVKLTGNQTVLGVKKFLGGSTIFQNLFIEGVPAGGVGFTGASRIEFSSGATTVYGSSNTLQVNASGTSITGGISCSGVITGTDCVASSDERLKDSITTAPVGLVEDLYGREWEWKETGEKGSGVVAQELEQVLPHLVHEDNEGMKSVSYNGLVAYLIEEVKALKVEVENLRNG